MADKTKLKANPHAKSEWTLGMALLDYFQIPIKEVAEELLAMRTMEKKKAIEWLESLKQMLVLEGYNIVPMAEDQTQQPKETILLPVVIEGHAVRVANDDGPNYEPPAEPLPPEVSCGYVVGSAHPAAPA